ncbi:hypothetical protein WICPIJ_008234 [Wickerhamomyces pijperi]|uniref:N-acetyltransferase domain-containing protein n=1 Tax=Wickerhamomyces pijperi TaxID=599730 RepID=A0A9P8PY95_WICPI|nr:hypothetical protein WICPIJ_008234 [Wickerhamomyces pijperi]
MAPSIQLDNITPNNKKLLQLINEVTLPVKFSDDYYKESSLNGFSKLSYYGETPVGVVKAKLQVPQGSSTPNIVYIESLAVLEPYRGLGIGKQFIDFIKQQAHISYIHEVTLHVWAKDEKVVQWYQKQGFVVKEKVPDYYKAHGLESPDALLLSLQV